MSQPSELSRRERQIMNAVYALGEATVNQVLEAISSPLEVGSSMAAACSLAPWASDWLAEETCPAGGNFHRQTPDARGLH